MTFPSGTNKIMAAGIDLNHIEIAGFMQRSSEAKNKKASVQASTVICRIGNDLSRQEDTGRCRSSNMPEDEEKYSEQTLQGINGKHWVQASHAFLREMKGQKITRRQRIIIDAFMARINSDDPSVRKVEFFKSDLEKITDSQIRTQALKTDIAQIVNLMINEYSETENRIGLKMYHPFEASLEIDKKTGWVKIILECTEKGLPYLYNVKRIGYFKYMLEESCRLKSKYSFELFVYVLSRMSPRGDGTERKWRVTPDELKKELMCENTKTYAEFKKFRQFILDPSVEEINQNTHLHIDFKTIHSGKSVSEIEFEVTDSIRSDLPRDKENEEDFGFLLSEQQAEEAWNEYEDLEEIRVEIIKSIGIPKSYLKDRRRLETALRTVTRYSLMMEEFEKSRKLDERFEFQRSVFVCFFNTLSEMLQTETVIKGTSYVPEQVLDRLNQCMEQRGGEVDISTLQDDIMRVFMDATRGKTIRNTRGYMASVIWDRISKGGALDAFSAINHDFGL